MPELGRYVGPVGNPNARIMIVGEAPGKDEERVGRPFVGASGSNILDPVLAKYGVLRKDIFVTNVCRHRPPYNNIGKWVKIKRRGKIQYVAGIEPQVARGVVELFSEIRSVNPNVIVPVGNTALWALTGLRQIARRRGSILDVSWDLERAAIINAHGLLKGPFVEDIAAIQGTKVIPTLHPASILRNYAALPLFQTDIKRIVSDQHFRELRLPVYDVLIDPGPDRFEDLRRYFLDAELLAYDIESLAGTPFCVGFARDLSLAVTYTTAKSGNMELIRELLESDIPKLAQNGLFDKSYLRMYSSIEVKNFAYDSMVAHAVSYPELPKGLDTLGSIYTREPYFKDEGIDWKTGDIPDIQQFLNYNAKDVRTMLESWLAMLGSELKDPLYRKRFDAIMEELEVYCDMMTGGIRMDVPRMNELEEEYTLASMGMQDELDKTVLAQLYEIVQKTGKQASFIEGFIRKIAPGLGTLKGALNVNSAKDMQTYCYDIMGYKEKKKKNTHGVMTRTTDEDALKELFTETGSVILLTACLIRQKRKRISSYLRVKTDSRGVTYFSMNPVRTKTGRSSCGKTTTGFGNNKQTVPHEIREIYIPEPGYEFGYWDLDQAEARVVAYTAGVRKMLMAFENPGPKYTSGDVHSLTAHEILGIPYDEMEEYPHRYLGKKCNHAFNYEMGYIKFWKVIAKDAAKTGISMTRSEANAYRKAHFKAYPELEGYWDWIKQQLLRRDSNARTLINPLGRKRVFLGRMDNDTFREAYSDYAQGTVAVVLRTGMVAVHNDLVLPIRRDHPHTRVVLEVHDALLMQYPIELRDSFTKTGLELMNVPMQIHDQEVTIPTSAEYGPNWGEMTKWTDGKT